MRRMLTGTAAAAALATAFAIPVAFAQETQQGKQAPAAMESGQHRQTGQGQTRERTGEHAAQAQTDQSRMSGEKAQGQTTGEQAGKPGMKGESAQTQERRTEPGKAAQTGSAANQNRAGQAETGMQNRQGAAQTGRSGGRQITAQNVQTMGKTNLPHDKAAKVAQTLMASGGAQSSTTNININEVSVGANLPADVVIDPLPQTIVELVPAFRGYDYIIVSDEIIIIDPATRQVVEIIEGVG